MRSARRLPLQALALLASATVSATVVVTVLRDEGAAQSAAREVPGPVLLVPGYGGDTAGLQVLAERLRREGRTTRVVQLPAGGTGDLEDAALALRAEADRALAAGASSVDVVGYSAGGVTARLWALGGGAAQARRVVTLGSPHHGTDVSALGATFADGACPSACQELVPGSRLLQRLSAADETPDGPAWLTVWTRDDTVVTPPDSGRLEGAEEVVVQDLCPGTRLDHGRLPHDPTVQAVVVRFLSAGPPVRPGPEVCVQGPRPAV